MEGTKVVRGRDLLCCDGFKGPRQAQKRVLIWFFSLPLYSFCFLLLSNCRKPSSFWVGAMYIQFYEVMYSYSQIQRCHGPDTKTTQANGSIFLNK